MKPGVGRQLYLNRSRIDRSRMCTHTKLVSFVWIFFSKCETWRIYCLWCKTIQAPSRKLLLNPSIKLNNRKQDTRKTHTSQMYRCYTLQQAVPRVLRCTTAMFKEPHLCTAKLPCFYNGFYCFEESNEITLHGTHFALQDLRFSKTFCWRLRVVGLVWYCNPSRQRHCVLSKRWKTWAQVTPSHPRRPETVHYIVLRATRYTT